MPVARRHRKAVPGDEFAGTFQAFAHLGPAAAVMFAQVAQESGTVLRRERPEIGAPHRRRRDWNTRADVELDAERESVPALAEIDHAVAVAAADRHRAAGLAHHFLAERLRQKPEPPNPEGRQTQRT